MHDVSDGGLLVALAEMAMASGIGARLDAPPPALPPHAFWFGEDQGRYVVTVRQRWPKHGAQRRGVQPACHSAAGRTGGETLDRFRANGRFLWAN